MYYTLSFGHDSCVDLCNKLRCMRGNSRVFNLKTWRDEISDLINNGKGRLQTVTAPALIAWWGQWPTVGKGRPENGGVYPPPHMLSYSMYQCVFRLENKQTWSYRNPRSAETR